MSSPVISTPDTATTLDLPIPRGLFHPALDYTRQDTGPAILAWSLYGSGFLCGLLFALLLGVVTAVVPAGAARFLAGAALTIIALIAFTVWEVRKAAVKLERRFTALVMDLAKVAARNGEKADRLFIGQQSIINGFVKSADTQIVTLRDYAESARLWAAWNEQLGPRVADVERMLVAVLEQLSRLEKAEARRRRRQPAERSAGSCADRNQDGDAVDKLFQAYMAGRYDAERNGGDTPPVA